jgi:hypothetical protein
MRRKLWTWIRCWQRPSAENRRCGHLLCDSCSGRDAVNVKLTRVQTLFTPLGVQGELFGEEKG